MATASKAPVATTPGTVTPKSKTTAVAKTAAPAKSASSPIKKAPATVAKKITPATPESKTPASTGRKRLSKAFARPLDKKATKIRLVRDRFTIPESEYEQLAQLKKRLSTLGFAIKKSELLRAGLLQLVAMDDAKLKAATAKLSVARIDD
jgi:hypothetical protein